MSESLIFASGFDGGIADIKIGPDDGYLYVLTLSGVDLQTSSFFFDILIDKQ